MSIDKLDYDIVSLEVRQTIKRRTKNILRKLWLPKPEKKISALGFNEYELKLLAKDLEGVMKKHNAHVLIYGSDLEHCNTVRECIDYVFEVTTDSCLA